ncbi:MAG: hypothetical protein EXS14_06995 [Planctomycetes bacterium]|nr:hypothetical protein [Planctomycetota bacterium]
MLEDGLFDKMSQRNCERLRWKSEGGALRVLCAQPDGDWDQATTVFRDEELAPTSLAFSRGGHERLDFVWRAETGLRLICAVHSTELGPGAGGLRRHELVIPEREVIRDSLNLSRAMTCKHAAAGIKRGGSKLVLHSPGVPEYGRDRFLSVLAEEIDLSGTVTGPDTGLPPSVFEALAVRSPNVTGCGSSAHAAATGVRAAIGAVAASLGAPLAELHVGVQGLGTLGLPLARKLVTEVGTLSVTDTDHRRIDLLTSMLNTDERDRVQIVPPYQLGELAMDIFAPCALGALITPQRIPSLRMRAICGGANNILAADSLGEELELAGMLLQAGIVFIPDWLSSAGGTIHASTQWAEGLAFDEGHARARIQRHCGATVDRILGESRQTAHAPLEIAVRELLLPRNLRCALEALEALEAPRTSKPGTPR